MVYIKTKEEIRIIKEGGRRLAAILRRLKEEMKPGTSTAYLEDLAETLIKEVGGRAAFKNYPMGGGLFFPSALCVSINDEVVHGASLPDRILEEGDIVDLDIGMEWPVDESLRQKFQAPVNPHSKDGGFFTDMCATFPIGKVDKETQKLLRVTEECLHKAIKVIKPGKRINDIARVIERHAENHGYGVVRDLVGHGVGYYAHEEPDVFNFSINPDARENIVLKAGMVIAVEPMINAGDWRVKMHPNGYTILTRDASYSAHFEHTIAITEDGCEVLTK